MATMTVIRVKDLEEHLNECLKELKSEPFSVSYAKGKEDAWKQVKNWLNELPVYYVPEEGK